MSSLDRNTKLALGYSFIYPVLTKQGNIFLGIVDEHHWHLIKCYTAKDYRYRRDALLECEFYELGKSEKELKGLKNKAREREGKPSPIKHMGANRMSKSKLPNLEKWEEMA